MSANNANEMNMNINNLNDDPMPSGCPILRRHYKTNCMICFNTCHVLNKSRKGGLCCQECKDAYYMKIFRPILQREYKAHCIVCDNITFVNNKERTGGICSKKCQESYILGYASRL